MPYHKTMFLSAVKSYESHWRPEWTSSQETSSLVSSIRDSKSSPFFKWMVSQLPSVEEIAFESAIDKETSSNVLNFLCSIEDVCLQDTLKILAFQYCGLYDNDLEIILFKIHSTRI